MSLALSWLPTLFGWYLGVLALGLIFLPLNSLVFRRFSDRGYPFAKVLGILGLSYIFFVLSFLKIAPFTQPALILLLVSLLLINFYIKKRYKVSLPSGKTIFAYEALFLLMFGCWTYLKGFEPTIHSLEKYMDFGFIQTILNERFLPPQDMWFASTIEKNLSINYYYYGHMVAAILIKLTKTAPAVGYNLTLTTIFAWGTTLSFGLGKNLYQFLTKEKVASLKAVAAGVLSMAIMNIGGNLHTIYLFTKGYIAENPVPFWQILSGYNPLQYWYPNATRFIPFTIHEFPSYSYIVSDLHGHVLDIPFVLLLLALSLLIATNKNSQRLWLYLPLYGLGLAVNYMTNSTDFLVYSALLFFVLVIRSDDLKKVTGYLLGTVVFALILTLPFSLNFKPFASALGVNCAPDFLVKLGKVGPFLFEADKCQTSPFWMLAILWGFFWINFAAFLRTVFFTPEGFAAKNKLRYYFFFVFVMSILLTLFAEFFYFKDIYPAHFRANTMFKLGYQAFIMLSILSGVIIVYVLKALPKGHFFLTRILYTFLVLPTLFLVLIYYQYAIPSYFGKQGFKTLDGSAWIKESYPESFKIINRLNLLKEKEPFFNIIEAHGDSYTDFNLISAHTGIPTIIGWPVHEWLWRGSYDIVAPRVEEVRLVYEGSKNDLPKIRQIIKKYRVGYIVIAEMEKQKYPKLLLPKFYKIGTPVYQNQKIGSYLFKVND